MERKSINQVGLLFLLNNKPRAIDDHVDTKEGNPVNFPAQK